MMLPTPKRLARAVIVCLVLLITGLLWLSYNPWAVQNLLVASGLGSVDPTRGPLPPAPTLTAPRGELPHGFAGLSEWAQDTGGGMRPVGCGFLLKLDRGVIGVATAHSTADWSGATRGSLERIAFHLPGQAEALIEFDTFYGPPGRVFRGYHFSQDYKLLNVTQPISEGLALAPDPRGAPQPGERVTLFSGLSPGADGGPRTLAGTVTTVSPDAIWVQMDEAVDPAGMSGSPLLSQHTGKVVGMAVSATRDAPVMVGFHPIGSIVEKANAAREFPKIGK
jgi:hypothetical protein